MVLAKPFYDSLKAERKGQSHTQDLQVFMAREYWVMCFYSLIFRSKLSKSIGVIQCTPAAIKSEWSCPPQSTK